MAAWSDGYVTDIEYVANFYFELSPSYLAFCCLRQGVRAPRLGPGASYLELGCGQGFSLNLLAAANPGLDFWGVDFNPAHIANARRLAAAAGLPNATFEDFSFEELLALPEGRLPKFDVVALHGVLSWISPENRALVVRIIDRVLKPGGLAYVSYNSLPGWASLIPLQRFMVDYVARNPGDLRV
ncbi:MAG: class I SAM-dependent methyltransferase, partial [Caulobacteraceae bacterium]